MLILSKSPREIAGSASIASIGVSFTCVRYLINRPENVVFPVPPLPATTKIPLLEKYSARKFY